MSSEPPKRHSSTELTAVRPRGELPPISMVPGVTIEALADVERMRRELAQERETMMTCPWCRDGLCTPEQRAAWLAAHPELAAEEPPPSQPEPESPPEAA